MLKEGYYMSPNEGQEEFEEVQSDLKKQEDEVLYDILIRHTEEKRSFMLVGKRKFPKTSR